MGSTNVISHTHCWVFSQNNIGCFSCLCVYSLNYTNARFLDWCCMSLPHIFPQFSFCKSKFVIQVTDTKSGPVENSKTNGATSFFGHSNIFKKLLCSFVTPKSVKMEILNPTWTNSFKTGFWSETLDKTKTQSWHDLNGEEKR